MHEENEFSKYHQNYFMLGLLEIKFSKFHTRELLLACFSFVSMMRGEVREITHLHVVHNPSDLLRDVQHGWMRIIV